MSKKRIMVGIILLLFFVVFYIDLNYDSFYGITEYFKKQNFDEIALKHYDDTEFEGMYFYVEEDIRSTSDKEKINEVLKYFKTLEYKRVSERDTYSFESDMREISLSTSNSGRLYIDVLNEKYITLGLGYIRESHDEEKNITKIEQNSEYKIYKVVDDKIDIDLIEAIYEIMEKVEE